MKFAWLGCLFFGSLLIAGTEDSETNVNSRYTVESVIVSGDGWTTNLASGGEDHRISSGLRHQITDLIGNKLSPSALDDLAGKLRKEFHARTVTHRILRGAAPEYVQVVFDISLRPSHFDLSVPKFLYSGREGWNGAVEGTATVAHNGFTVGIVSDGDELAERYSGVVARYENTQLGSDRLHFRFQFASYHEQWNGASRSEVLPDDTSEFYRTRQDVEPVATVVLAKPLTLSIGFGFQRFQDEGPDTQTEAANAFLTGLRYQRTWEGSEQQQNLDAAYDLREATRMLDSDFVYGRHHWNLRYEWSHGKHVVIDDLTAGMLTGRAPLFERFVLGNSTTLRGWNKFEIDPLGGNRMVHNSVEYRYGVFEMFYDAGAAWDSGQSAVLRHSIGTGLRQGPLFVAVAFPVREGRVDPIFMVGMNY
ncbi:MAG TPA: BamA/TamA family outer membrane protein [Bryobacteraceae bacterium]|nr:BamA/TamA family outer membrane protein [Bryobacteraceae bacterium]